MKYLLFLISTLSFFVGKSAPNNTPDVRVLKSRITLDLLSSVYIPFPRVRAGYEHFVKKDLSIGLDLGFMKFKTNAQGDTYYHGKDYKYFEVRPHVNYFFDNYLYVGIEMYFTQNSQYMEDRNYGNFFYSKKNQVIVRYEAGKWKRTRTGGNFYLAMRTPDDIRIGLDGHIGLGLRMKNNSYYNLKNPTSEFSMDGYFNEGLVFLNPAYREGNSVFLSFTMSLQVHYNLFK